MDTPFKTSSAPAAAEQTPHKSCMRVGIHAFGTLCSPLYEHESNPDKRRRLRKRRQSGLMLLPSVRKLKRTTAAQAASSAKHSDRATRSSRGGGQGAPNTDALHPQRTSISTLPDEETPRAPSQEKEPRENPPKNKDEGFYNNTQNSLSWFRTQKRR